MVFSILFNCRRCRSLLIHLNTQHFTAWQFDSSLITSPRALSVNFGVQFQQWLALIHNKSSCTGWCNVVNGQPTPTHHLFANSYANNSTSSTGNTTSDTWTLQLDRIAVPTGS